MNFVNYSRTPIFLEDLQIACSHTPVTGSLFNKFASLRARKLVSVVQTLPHRYFSVNFKKFFGKFFCRTPPSNHF